MRSIQSALSLAICLVWATTASQPLQAAGLPAFGTLEIQIPGRKLEGTPVHWTANEVDLLGRDGRLTRFDPKAVASYRPLSANFRPYSPSEFRACLLRELGKDYEVSGTAHYLIAHPRGQRDRWAERFEDLYRSFVHFFSVRGLELSAPAFPMVGIVCKDRREFIRQAATQGALAAGVVGYYDLLSNRLTIYDMGGSGSANWQQNAAVLIHEATHQTAFNSGVHSRYQPPPLWVAEGLAMLFEAPGIYDPRNRPQISERINRERLQVFQELLAPRHRPEILRDMIARDHLFESNPSAAYAEAWALSFVLAESEPQKYIQYLKRTASRRLEPYTAAERLAEFVAIFGDDWRMLEARLLRQMASLKIPRQGQSR